MRAPENAVRPAPAGSADRPRAIAPAAARISPLSAAARRASPSRVSSPAERTSSRRAAHSWVDNCSRVPFGADRPALLASTRRASPAPQSSAALPPFLSRRSRAARRIAKNAPHAAQNSALNSTALFSSSTPAEPSVTSVSSQNAPLSAVPASPHASRAPRRFARPICRNARVMPHAHRQSAVGSCASSAVMPPSRDSAQIISSQNAPNGRSDPTARSSFLIIFAASSRFPSLSY